MVNPKLFQIIAKKKIPVEIYFFKINNGDTRAIREIISKLTIKTLERR